MSGNTKGALAVFFAYLIWGILPVYWKAMASVDPLEILAHRAVWSCVFSLLLLSLTRGVGNVVSLVRSNRRTLAMLAISGVTITVNWYTFIWAVNNDRILETSLGYFINPLVSILFGVIIFRERLRKIQWLAIALAASGVCVEIAKLGQVPAVALMLAFTFGAYGLLKKMLTVDSITGLTTETLFITPFALFCLFWRQNTGAAHFPYQAWTNILLVSTGVLTAIPLIIFAWGVKRTTMTLIGLTQYTSPIMMFLSATLVYHESISPARLLTFSLTWAGIIVFTAESFWFAKKRLRPIEK
jgi:chloramphenicol-sensitive protein RarD